MHSNAIASCLKAKNILKVRVPYEVADIFNQNLKQTVQNEFEKPNNEKNLPNFVQHEPHQFNMISEIYSNAKPKHNQSKQNIILVPETEKLVELEKIYINQGKLLPLVLDFIPINGKGFNILSRLQFARKFDSIKHFICKTRAKLKLEAHQLSSANERKQILFEMAL